MANSVDGQTASPAGAVGRVLRAAVISRMIVLLLSISFRVLFDPYDTSAGLNPPCFNSNSSASGAYWARFVAAAVERGVVWDSVYFVRIAECEGYEYEQSYAFFPLLPVSMNALARSIFRPVIHVLGWRAVIVLSGYVINNVAFVLAAVYFYKLSVLILKDTAASLRASMLFCFNPASIFYSSIYSESLYALCSFAGQYHLFSGSSTVAVILLALSGASRSNGALNAGYFCFQALLEACDAIVQKRKSKVLLATIAGISCSICIFVPFVAFEIYGYNNICLYSTEAELRPWCKAKLPFLYGFIQSHYWGVGFLRYFQVKQLPNFLLASPMLYVAISSIIEYLCSLPQVVRSMYNTASAHIKEADAMTYADKMSARRTKTSEGKTVLRQRKNTFNTLRSSSGVTFQASHKNNNGYNSVMVLPFVLHLAFLTFTASFVMHVQVTTRFLSASPPIYWYTSYVMVSPKKSARRFAYFMWFYSIVYLLLGSLLFSNFYPFT